MKRIHRKVIALQARLCLKMVGDMRYHEEGAYNLYKLLRGVNYDIHKAKCVAKGIKPAKLASIFRSVLREERQFIYDCKGRGRDRRMDGYAFNVKKIIVRSLVGPFNEGYIEHDENGIAYIRDESSFSTLAQLIP